MLSPLDATLDIETTGLNFAVDRVTTVAIVSNHGDTIEVYDNPYDEQDVLFRADQYVRTQGFERIGTWNGSEFDMPFLATRMVLSGRGIHGGPYLRPMKEGVWDGLSEPPLVQGKYGKPRYTATWWGTKHHDVAYDYEKDAYDLRVPWSLKPVATAFGVGVELPFRVDFETRGVLGLTSDERELYCASDAQQALLLWSLKESSMTIL